MDKMNKIVIVFTIAILFLFITISIIKYKGENVDNQLTQQIEKLNKRVTKVEEIIINSNEKYSSPIDCTKCVGCYNGKKKSIKHQTINGGDKDSIGMQNNN